MIDPAEPRVAHMLRSCDAAGRVVIVLLSLLSRRLQYLAFESFDRDIVIRTLRITL